MGNLIRQSENRGKQIDFSLIQSVLSSQNFNQAAQVLRTRSQGLTCFGSRVHHAGSPGIFRSCGRYEPDRQIRIFPVSRHSLPLP